MSYLTVLLPAIACVLFWYVYKNAKAVGVSIKSLQSMGGDGGVGGAATSGENGVAIGGSGGGGGGSAPSVVIVAQNKDKASHVEWVSLLGIAISALQLTIDLYQVFSQKS